MRAAASMYLAERAVLVSSRTCDLRLRAEAHAMLAAVFGWLDVSTSGGAYLEDSKQFVLSATVGRDDGELTLVGTLSGSTHRCDVSTGALRVGTWSVEKK